SYGCGNRVVGQQCTNNTRVKKSDLERAIIDPILARLRDPAKVASMAKEMEQEYARRMQQRQRKMTAVPRDVARLDDRIERYRTMADLEEDERQALMATAQARRTELLALHAPQAQGAKIMTIL